MAKNSMQKLIEWSDQHYSNLPWRIDRSLYKTLVSEIMLQQTTVATVLNHFDRFLKIYPTILKLAQSSEEEICIQWKGLGYYRRARNLRNIARQIIDQHEGLIPNRLDALMSLKGIGPYTANALIAIGADRRALAIDANLERVLARLYGYQVPKGTGLQKKIAEDFSDKKILLEMDKIGARKINEALMDLGRVICQARKASCSLCPLRQDCVAYKSGKPEGFPLGGNDKKAIEHELHLLRVVVREKNKILFYQKKDSEWLAGQWELPTFIIHSSDKNLIQYPKLKWRKSFEALPVIKTGITKYAITNFIIELSPSEFKELVGDHEHFHFKINNEKLNLSTASIKVLKKIE
jgi:A/G-specific adenine glycosylase